MAQPTKTPTAPNDPARVSAIAAAIKAAVSPITGVDLDKADAATAKATADSAAVNTREAIFVILADLAYQGQWTNSEITAAATQAITGTGANSEKAMATFVSECKNAMHEAVRVYVNMLVDVRNQALADEAAMKKEDKDARLPCKLAWSRQYHMLMAMFGAAKDGNVLTTVEKLTAYAEEVLEERAGDAGKAHAEKEKLVAQIRDLYKRFPDDDFQAAAETLEGITKTHMEKARALSKDVETAKAEDRMIAHPLAPVPAVVASRFGVPTTIPTVVNNGEGGDVAQGAVDILDQFLKSNDAGVALAA